MPDDVSAASIQHVSDTALVVAVYRAIESARPDALFHDLLADRLAGERGRRIVAGLSKRSTLTRWSVVLRTCIIDELIQRAVRQGVDTVLNLGAGLDARPYRMALPPSLHWIEVDYPHVIELKEGRLADATPVCKLERVKLDLADCPARLELFARIGAQAGEVLVLSEGVVPYLTTDATAALADDIAAQPRFSRWVTDYVSPQLRRWRVRSSSTDLKNAPWRFAPDDFFGFFGQHGWQAGEVRYYHDEARRLHRPVPLPVIKKLAYGLKYVLASRQQRKTMRTLAGYVLFERVTASPGPVDA